MVKTCGFSVGLLRGQSSPEVFGENILQVLEDDSLLALEVFRSVRGFGAPVREPPLGWGPASLGITYLHVIRSVAVKAQALLVYTFQVAKAQELLT